MLRRSARVAVWLETGIADVPYLVPSTCGTFFIDSRYPGGNTEPNLMTLRTLSTLAMVCLAGLLGAPRAHAAVPTSTLASVVKLQVHDDRLNVIGSGAGIIIDADGRVLTSYQAVKAWEKFKKQPITVCPTIDPYLEPRCTMRAIVLKTSPGHDLALLQIQSIAQSDVWMTIEERMLRQSFAFPFSRIHTTATTESVDLGEELALIGYPSVGGATLTYTKSSVTGFQRRTQKTSSAPWLIKTESKFTSTNIGGAAFTLAGDFIGMPTHASGTKESLGQVISLPVIAAFLKDALGKEYVQGTSHAYLQAPLVGIQNGLLKTSSDCPEFASSERNSKACRCRPGFFAVGNACILGQVYCPLRFPDKGAYDPFVKQCLCPNAAGGTSACALPTAPATPKPAPVPTPTQACSAIKNTVWNATKKTCDCKTGYGWNKNKTACEGLPKPVPPPTCPALATYSTTTKACVCTKPYSLNGKKDACIFVGKPATIAQLQRCEFIGKLANKLYYPKGHSIIKQMTYLGKQCFATEADAQTAKFKRTTTK